MSQDESLPQVDGTNDDGDMGDHNQLRPLINLYLRDRKSRGELNKESAATATVVLNGFADTFGNRAINRLTEAFVKRWQATRRYQHWKPATRRANWTRVRLFARWLVRKRYLKIDPFQDLKAPAIPVTSGRPIPRTNLAAIYTSCANNRDALIVALMHECGCRAVEVSRLNVEHIDRHERTMHLIGKGGHERDEPMTRALLVYIDRYLDEYPASSGPLIRHLSGEPRRLRPKTISGMMSKIMYRAEVKRRAWDGVNGHALRHSAATEILVASGDLRVAQQLLGHLHLASTTRYIGRVDMVRVREALEQRGDDAA